MASVEMKISTLALDKKTKSPFVLLTDTQEEFAIPIYIGLMEANAIAMELEKMKPPRPMTHDLLASVIRSMGGRLQRIEVTELTDNTFYAKLFIEVGGKVIDVDARPSDSIALAIRLHAPIWVAESVLEAAHVTDDERKQMEREKWKEFLENLDDDDFGEYKM